MLSTGLEKKTIDTLNQNASFHEICEDLDRRKLEFEASGKSGKNLEEVWISYINRKNTFLTSK